MRREEIERLKREKAAKELEGIAAAAMELARYLVESRSVDKGYAMAYDLRRRLGHVVSSLGAGRPEADSWHWAKHEIERIISGMAQDVEDAQRSIASSLSETPPE